MSISMVRVLVVDDQAVFRSAMSAVVAETDGFEVVGQARSGEESLTMAAALRPDLVLMDVNLQGMDGLEATHRLRSREAPPVVVLLSTYDVTDGVRFVAWSGAACYVTKSSLSPDRLTAAWAVGTPSGSSDDRGSGDMRIRGVTGAAGAGQDDVDVDAAVLGAGAEDSVKGVHTVLQGVQGERVDPRPGETEQQVQVVGHREQDVDRP